MELQKYINSMVMLSFETMKNNKGYSRTQMSNEVIYEREIFFIPRVWCKDGFHISIQVNSCSYCASEKGIRHYGNDWKLVEWGYPSMPIDGKKYHAEEPDNTMESVGSYVEVSLLQELMDEHGGIDMDATVAHACDKMKC